VDWGGCPGTLKGRDRGRGNAAFVGKKKKGGGLQTQRFWGGIYYIHEGKTGLCYDRKGLNGTIFKGVGGPKPAVPEAPIKGPKGNYHPGELKERRVVLDALEESWRAGCTEGGGPCKQSCSNACPATGPRYPGKNRPTPHSGTAGDA